MKIGPLNNEIALLRVKKKKLTQAKYIGRQLSRAGYYTKTCDRVLPSQRTGVSLNRSTVQVGQAFVLNLIEKINDDLSHGLIIITEVCTTHIKHGLQSLTTRDATKFTFHEVQTLLANRTIDECFKCLLVEYKFMGKPTF